MDIAIRALATFAALTLSLGTAMAVDTVPIDTVWSGHSVGFDLHSADGRQYAVYYDHARRMTVAGRDLGSSSWQIKTLPSTTGWDGHNYVVVGVDLDGYIHVSGNMHNKPLIYFRSTRPHDLSSLEGVHHMTGNGEDKVTYPRFMTDAEGRMVFMHRIGSSGNGKRLLKVYNEKSRSWSALIDTALLDGASSGSNAYPREIVKGPDGWFHLSWMWRKTSNADTNHHLSYAKSKDLAKWVSADSTALSLPITPNQHAAIVDPTGTDRGLLNLGHDVRFDADGRPMIAYYRRHSSTGATHIFIARFENGEWVLRQVSPDSWTYYWDIDKTGSLSRKIGYDLQVLNDGRITLKWWHTKYGSGAWQLDHATLARTGRISVPSPIPSSLRSTTTTWSGSPGLQVNWHRGTGDDGIADGSYWLRWETLPGNNDKPRTSWPGPTELAVYAFDDVISYDSGDSTNNDPVDDTTNNDPVDDTTNDDPVDDNQNDDPIVIAGTQVRVTIDPTNSDNYDIGRWTVDYLSGDSAIVSVELSITGGGVFDYWRNASVSPFIGGNGGANSPEITVDLEQLAPGTLHHGQYDTDGLVTGIDAIVTFADGSRLAGALVDVGDSDDGDSEHWTVLLGEDDQTESQDPVDDNQTDSQEPSDASVRIVFDDEDSSGWDNGTWTVSNLAGSRVISTVAVSISGGGDFDTVKNADTVPSVGGNGGADSSDIVMHIGPLAAGEQKGGFYDIDGSVGGMHATVTFDDGSTLSGDLVNVGDSDDGDSDRWVVELGTDDSNTSNQPPTGSPDSIVLRGSVADADSTVASVTVNGAAASLNGGEWQLEAPVSEGTISFEVIITDDDGALSVQDVFLDWTEALALGSG